MATHLARFLDPLDRPSRRVAVIGHRGAPRTAPENTLRSFRNAIDEGADGIEFDIHLTADNRLVVMHDRTVDRCTDGAGPIAEHSLDELRRLDAGGWFGSAFSGERVPVFTEALEVMRERVLPLVEIKTQTDRGAADLASIILAELDSLEMRRDVVLHSFDPTIITALHQADSALALAISSSEATVPPAWIGGVHPEAPLVTAALVETAHAAGHWVCTWTVNTESTVQQLADLEVDGIMSDDPAMVITAISSAG
ncbi:MAG: glycerophosphodiester phosphodiesterase [Lentisphaeria bacterium]